MAAIYQWFPGITYVITSTIYTIEIVDGVEMSLDVSGGRMEAPWTEGLDMDKSYQSGVVNIILFNHNMDDEGLDMTPSYRESTVSVILLTHNMDDEGLDMTSSYIESNVTLRKVTALLPEQGVEFGLVCTDGSMSLV